MVENEESGPAPIKQGLIDLAKKFAADNPGVADLNLLNKHLLEIARKRLAEQGSCSPFGGYLNEDGSVSVIESEANVTQLSASLDGLFQSLRALARSGAIRAGSVCEIVERPVPRVNQSVLFVQFHCEHRCGLAFVIGKPADEKLFIQSVPDMNGVAVTGYNKRVAPRIFQS